MLRELDRNLWVAKQPLKYLGLEVGTRMTVVGLSDETLAVISPIKVTTEIKRELDAIGTVAHIIAPNLYHYLYAGECKSLYPEATFWGTTGLQKKQPELAIDKVIQSNKSELWRDFASIFFDGFKTLGPNGFDPLNEWVFLHADSRTLILTDTAFHYDGSFPLVNQLAARVLGCYDALTPSTLDLIGN